MSLLRTLRGRFALWTAGLLLAALVLFSSFVYLRMARSLTGSVDDALRLVATQITAEVDVAGGDFVAVEELLEDIPNTPLNEYGFSFRLVNRAGVTRQTYGPYRALPPLQPDAPPTGSFTTISDPLTRQPVRVYTVPVFQNDQWVGAVQVAQNLSGVRQTLNQLLITLLIGGPLLVAVAGLGGYFLAARALTPIDQITQTARQISADDLSARLNLPPTNDEAGRLAATFDSMLARLEAAFRRERRFTADASHELRTPLTAMITIISSTLARPRTPTEYERVLIDLSEETGRLRTLVEGLLQLTHSDAPARPAVKEPVDLSTLLADVTDSLRVLAEEKHLTLTPTVPAGLTIPGDSDALIRLFVNIIANAINYTERGQIDVTAGSTANGFIEVIVTDTGVGIAPQHLPHIFDRFYRVDASRSTNGAGLGLAIAMNIARSHGGTIMVDSKISQGTAVTVQLAAN
ncbi:MAG: HAMP domain-containing protein [Anaerolineales bacterium]|nr:HAMP domain-containing protein [Anaerolineales bacterium]